MKYKLKVKWEFSGKRGIWAFPFLLLLACVPNKNFQTPGVDDLQGIWIEKPGPEKSNPENLYYSINTLRFSCDSVYITSQIHSRYNYEDPHCFNGGKWTEYQKAGYTLSHDSLILEGVYTKPNFRMKISGCYHSGNFHEVYKIKRLVHSLGVHADSKDSLILYPPHEEGKIHFFRSAQWKCKPHRLE